MAQQLERKRLEQLLEQARAPGQLEFAGASVPINVSITRDELEELVTGYTCLMALGEILGEIVPKRPN